MQRVVGWTVMAGAFALAIACSKGSSGAGTTTGAAAGSTVGAAGATTGAAASAPAPQLNDANIAALLDEANAGDSAAGSIAEKKGTNAQVKDFGRTMVRDHHMLRKQGQDLAKKLNLTPQPPANDTLASSAKTWGDSLNAMPKGAAWDKAYIDHEVAAHEAVLQLLQTASGAAQNAQLKDLIQKAEPAVQGHLAKAKQVQQRVGGAASDTTAAGGGGAKKK